MSSRITYLKINFLFFKKKKGSCTKVGIINAYGEYPVLWPTRWYVLTEQEVQLHKKTSVYQLSPHDGLLGVVVMQGPFQQLKKSWVKPKRENVATRSQAFSKAILRWRRPMSTLTWNTEQLHRHSPFVRQPNHWARTSEDDGFLAFFCFHLMFQCSATIRRKRQRAKIELPHLRTEKV